MPQRKTNLAQRIAFASVVISTLSGLGLGALTALADYRRSFDLALENHGRIIAAALPQLESAYWDLDLAAVQATLDRLAETPLVQGVRIRDLVFSADELASVAVFPLAAASDRPPAPVWPLSQIVPAAWLVETRDLSLHGRAGSEPIASLEVRLNFAGLYDELGYRALSSMASTVLQALLIAGLLFWLIRDRVIKPLTMLTRAARSHRETGSFQLASLPLTEVGHPREDEISVLARDFGRTVMRMERYRDHLREEVEQRTAELIVARNDALAASRAKSVFLANMSHELRTPLNAITGLSDLLLAEGQAPTTRRHITDMRHAARQLLGSIDQVLDLSKLEVGHMLYATAPFAPEDVFDEVIAQTRALAGPKPVVVEGDIDPAIAPMLLGDAQKITQILLNLTSNAVKFTAQGRIRLRFARRDKGVKITVADTGSGIATAKLAAIFMPFTQGNDSAARDVSGTGLGLSIARQMAEGMGGSLTLASRPGHGSLFVLRLPLRAAQAPRPAGISERPRLDLPEGRLRLRLAHMLGRLGPDAAQATDMALQSQGAGLRLVAGNGGAQDLPLALQDLPLALTHRELAEALAQARIGTPAPSTPSGLHLAGRHILLIEDREINRAVVEALLARAGARVTSVDGGQQALALAPLPPPDLILTDLHMPFMDGFDTIAALRAQGMVGVPVVALSADVSTETRASCHAAGFEGFIAKPLTAEGLWAEIGRVLAASPPPPAALDRTVLLRHAGGDPALAQVWLRRLPQEIAGWREMLVQMGATEEVLHLIQGSAAQVGACAVAEACAAAHPDPDRLLQLLADLAAAVSALPPAPIQPKPAGDLPERIAACRSALLGHEMRGFDLLEGLLPDLPPEDATALHRAVHMLDFQAALAVLGADQR